jgi:MFS family permease
VSGDIKPHIQKLGTHAKILLMAVLFACTLRNVGLSIVDLGLPSYIIELSGSLISYGIVIGIFSIMQSIFQFPIAAASDKFGRRLIVLIAMSVYIIGTFLCFFAQTIAQLIIFRAIQGIGAYTSILQAMIGDIFKKERHGTGMGYYSLSLNIGYFSGIILGGYISSYLGFRHIFSISGSLILLSTIFLLVVFKYDEFENAKNKHNNPGKHNRISLKRENIFKLLKDSEFNITIFLNSTRWFIFGGIVAYLVWILQEYYGLDEITSSYILIIIVAFYVGFVILSSRVLDKQGPKKMMLIGQVLAISFGFFFFFNFSKDFIVFLILTTAIGVGLALYDPAGSTLLLDVIVEIEPNLKGTGIGFNNAIGFFFGAVGPIIICWLGEYNIFFPFYLIFFLILIAFIITLTLIKDKHKNR